MLSSNLLKSKIPILGGRGGVGGTNFQLLMLNSNLPFPKSRGEGRSWWNPLSTFDAEFKFAKILNSYFRGGGVGRNNFQLLMLSSNLLKSKIPISGKGGEGVGGTNFQLLMLSSNLLKSKIPILGGGGLVEPTFNF